ncbi:hypothetical protein H5410_047222 [Solanum commersonii]|uniref:Protein kinase domain-containing protein n=1 Tax=Solanum commersonii TaxID=4109 RepID=A0A9J5XHN7_SOLCO|nr:hypothetical protein H5410_047222 [Solanum commersonii]
MPNSNSSSKIPISQEVENPSSFNFSFSTPEGCKEISCEKGESWSHLFEPPVPYFHEPEVHEFFYKIELLESGGMATIVRNVETCLDEEILGIILGVPVEGIRTIEGCKPSSDFTKLATKCGDVKNTGLLKRWIDLVDKEGNAKPIGGTPLFMPPEVARGEEQGCPADIWGLGCTIIKMATGGSPWTNVTNPTSLLYQIAFSGQSPKIPKLLSSQEFFFLKN